MSSPHQKTNQVPGTDWLDSVGHFVQAHQEGDKRVDLARHSDHEQAGVDVLQLEPVEQGERGGGAAPI